MTIETLITNLIREEVDWNVIKEDIEHCSTWPMFPYRLTEKEKDIILALYNARGLFPLREQLDERFENKFRWMKERLAGCVLDHVFTK